MKKTFPDEETSSALHDALTGPRSEDTMQDCAACADCEVCRGLGLATPTQNALYRARKAEKP